MTAGRTIERFCRPLWPGLSLLVLLVVLFLASCAGRPEALTEDLSSLVHREKEIYFHLKPSQDRVFAERMLASFGFDSKSLDKIVGKTESIHGSIAGSSEGFLYQLLVRGSFPETAVRLSLRAENGWKRVHGDFSWWEHENSGVRLAFLRNDLIALTNGEIESFLRRISSGPRTVLPEEVHRSLESSVMTVYASSPDLSEDLLPAFRSLDQVFCTFHRVHRGVATVSDRTYEKTDDPANGESPDMPSLYLVDGYYQCRQEEYARSLYLLLRLALLGELGKNPGTRDYRDLLEKDPVTLNQKMVFFENYPVSLENLGWFFSTALPFAAELIYE